MTITAAQIRQACVLLGWKAPMLSRRARISYKVALNARKDDRAWAVSGSDLEAIAQAFEAAGVEFGPVTNDGSGVMLRRQPPTERTI
ncbi:MAG: hypothetical protein ACRYGP_29995 [Janthinobacterium lividum]